MAILLRHHENLSLGTLGNTLASVVGGGLGGQILGMLGAGGMASGGGMCKRQSNTRPQ